MRTIPLVLITFFALSLSPTAARAGANGSWCANYGTGLDGAINCSYTSFEQCRAICPLLKVNRTCHRATVTAHIDLACVKTHTSAKCRKNHSPSRHRT